jgi:hypothetical protein
VYSSHAMIGIGSSQPAMAFWMLQKPRGRQGPSTAVTTHSGPFWSHRWLPLCQSGRAGGRPAGRPECRDARSAAQAAVSRPWRPVRRATGVAQPWRHMACRRAQARPRPAPKKVSSAQRWPVARPPDQSQARARARAPPAAARPPAVHAPPVRCSRKEHTTTTTRLALALQWRLLLPPTACLPAVMACGVRAA